MVFIDHKITHGKTVFYALNGIDPLEIPEVLAIIREEFSYPFFLSCTSNSSHSSFVICFSLVSDIIHFIALR